MLARTVALALVGSAAAFSPMMSMDMGRRQVVQAGAAAAVAAPLLRANPASAWFASLCGVWTIENNEITIKMAAD